MKKILSVAFAALLFSAGECAGQDLATFEDGAPDALSLDSTAWYDASLFSLRPAVCDNPDRAGINTSKRCVGAVNVADASWWGNFLVLKLAEPIVISDSNRYLNFQCYRSSQPKEMRIGFNGYEEDSQIWFGRMGATSQWQTLTVDLGEKFMGKTLSTLHFILSCNWSAPSSGWGASSCYLDNFALSSASADVATTYQTIDDFGASDCWLGDVVGKNWQESQKLSMARKLFSQEFDASGNPLGIGLSAWRVNLGAGTAAQGDSSGIADPNRRTECFLNADGSYDWTRQAGQQYFMQQAKKLGCEHFVLFSNTPPVYFTKNGKGLADAGETSCNLQMSKFGAFAEFMATVAKHFDDAGYDITYLSPVNEPQYDWTSNQEGSPWQNADITRLARFMNTSLTSRSSSTKVLLSEAGSWYCASGGSGRAVNQIPDFFDRTSADYLGSLPAVEKAYSAHSYWTHSTNDAISASRSQAWAAAAKYGIKTCQTEWSMLGDAPTTDTGFPASYDAATYNDIALFMAKLIQCDLTIANASTWSFWTAFDVESSGNKNRYLLLRLIPTGGDVHNGGIFTASKTLWMLGNYSRFIRPGYRRIALSGAQEMNGVLGSAYLAPDSSRLVCVFVNTARAAASRTLSFSGLTDRCPVGVSQYLTNVTHDLSLVNTATGARPTWSFTMPARSVVTVVYELARPEATPDGLTPLRSDVRRSGVYDLCGRQVPAGHRCRGICVEGGKKILVR